MILSTGYCFGRMNGWMDGWDVGLLGIAPGRVTLAAWEATWLRR